MTPFLQALLVGFLGWLVATVLFRFIGHYIFPLDVVVLALVFVVTPVALFFLARPIFRLLGFAPAQFPLAAAALVLPGMILDAFVVPNFFFVLPNIDRSLDGTFGGWLLLAYASLLLAGVLFRGATHERA
jgi:hypothetical protein